MKKVLAVTILSVFISIPVVHSFAEVSRSTVSQFVYESMGVPTYKITSNEDGEYFAEIEVTFPDSSYQLEWNKNIEIAGQMSDAAELISLRALGRVVRSEVGLTVVTTKKEKLSLGKLSPGDYTFAVCLDGQTYTSVKFAVPIKIQIIGEPVIKITQNENKDYIATAEITFPTGGYEIETIKDVAVAGIVMPDGQTKISLKGMGSVKKPNGIVTHVLTTKVATFNLGKLSGKYVFQLDIKGISAKPVEFEASDENTKKIGDLNRDGKINSTDYSILKRIILDVIKTDVNTLAYYKEAGDVDGDKRVSSLDAVYLKRYLLKMIDVFPIEKK